MKINIGILLIIAGILLLAVHYIFHLTQNWLMVIALLSEITGAYVYFSTIKKQK